MKTTVKVEFGKVTFGDKITLPMEIKGDLTDEQILTITKLSAKAGFATLSSAQMDIEDYGSQQDTGEHDENQVTLDDIEDEEELPFTPKYDADELPE